LQKTQVISLFHHLWFTRYKRLLSNMRNDFKGRRREIPYQEHEHWFKGP